MLVPAFFAMAAPKGTPPEIVQRLSAEIQRALVDPSVVERFQKLGLAPGSVNAADMRKSVANDLKNFGTLVNAIGIKVE